MRNNRALLLFFVITLLLVTTIAAQNQSGKYFTDENGVAIKGYDVVSYFTDYKALKGSSDFSLNYDGAIFYFTSEEHKNMFQQDPEHYLPQYGGYCAFGMAKMNSKVPTDPHTFKIVDGKLYLFFNDLYEGKKFNTIVPWNGDEANLHKLADKNWSAMK